MKKLCLFSLLFSLIMMTYSTGVAEEQSGIDLSELSIAELTALKNDITKELIQRTLSAETPVSTTPQVILFRDSPWLISETEMLDYLKPLNYNMYTHGEGDGYTEIGSWEIDFNSSGSLEKHIVTNREIGYWVYLPLSDTKVAGFAVKGISMQFLYGLDKVHVYRDSASSRMISASYLFSVAEPSEAFEVLLAKLSSLYGDPIAFEVESSCLYRHAVWYGADDTAVRLDMSSNNDRYELQLCYGVSNSLDLIAELQSTITNEIITEGSMDGL